MGSLVKIFANETLVKVLSLFFLNPATEFFQRAIATEIGKALIQVQRSLKILEELGLVSSRRQGRMIFYKADPGHVVFQDLKNIFLKTFVLGDTLRKEMQRYSKHIQFAWIYGSVAQGREKSDSDIDLAIISDLTLKELSQVTESLIESLDRELSPLFLTPKTFLMRIHEKDHFVTRLIQGEKIWMIGDDHQLRRFIESGSAKTARPIRSGD
jgi:predicted nucleotidyltransferase